MKSSFNVGVPVYDLASIINSPGETERLVVVSSVAKASAEKKRKFAVLNFDVASQKVTTKLASLQFPRRCTAVLKIPLARVLEATEQVLSMEALYQQDQAAIETVLVVASSRSIANVVLLAILPSSRTMCLVGLRGCHRGPANSNHSKEAITTSSNQAGQ